MANETKTSVKEENSAQDSELNLPLWSVVSFSGVEGSGLTYGEARDLRNRLDSAKLAGLCIVTDMAAARLRS